MNEFERQAEAAEGYLMLGMTEDAWEIVESFSPAQKLTRRALSLRLKILIVSKQWMKAALLAQWLCRLQPANAEAHVQAAALFANAGAYARALRWLQRHQAVCCHLPGYHFVGAKCMVGLEDFKGGKEALKRAFRIQALLQAETLDESALEEMCERFLPAMAGEPAAAR